MEEQQKKDIINAAILLHKHGFLTVADADTFSPDWAKVIVESAKEKGLPIDEELKKRQWSDLLSKPTPSIKTEEAKAAHKAKLVQQLYKLVARDIFNTLADRGELNKLL